jgi:hypothetical protein
MKYYNNKKTWGGPHLHKIGEGFVELGKGSREFSQLINKIRETFHETKKLKNNEFGLEMIIMSHRNV